MSDPRRALGAAPARAAAPEGPWNPGLRSPIPAEILPLSTLYRPENTFSTVAHARELADFTGLPLDELVLFRPERLITHELLIRVAADVSVPDGPETDDLGVTFRQMTGVLAARHVGPHAAEIAEAWARERERVRARVEAELERLFAAPAPRAPVASRRTWRERLGLRARPPAAGRPAGVAGAAEARAAREAGIIAAWREAAEGAPPEERVVRRALARTVGAIRARHGRVVGDREVLAEIATGLAVNVLGSELVGRLIEPHLARGIEAEGYRRLPAQLRPVVMNIKGASASGKSSMRPLQRALAARIGVDWAEFALISPDIFRKYLLDYASLGPAYKYAGPLTGEELRIVDQKLDRYMADKAARGAMTHMLIDRFRFDSFAPESDVEGSNLLTRFGSRVFMFFMVTPPHETVERAWERGLRVGRYKSVDDLLHHNVEAYTGMPGVFFTWARDTAKDVHYEFLDNSVPLGEPPRTIAFGANGRLVVLDPDRLLDIDRHRRIDVDARRPEAVYPPAEALAPARNLAFLRQCLERLREVDFADARTGRVALRVVAGRPVAANPAALRDAFAAPRTGAALAAAFPDLARAAASGATGLAHIDEAVTDERLLTLGRWDAGGA